MDGVTETGRDDHADGGRAGHRAGLRGARGARRAPTRTAASLTARLSDLGGPLLVEVHRRDRGGPRGAGAAARGGRLAGAQDRPRRTAPLDFSRPAVELARQRARPLAAHRRHLPHRRRALQGLGAPGPATRPRRRVSRSGTAGWWPAAAEGSLEILELQPPGRARMDAGAFLRGWRGALELGPVGAEAPVDARGRAPDRSVALRVLRRVDEGAYADRALAAEARRAELDPRARAQATRLAYGAVQRRRTLDWLIDGAARPPGRAGAGRARHPAPGRIRDRLLRRRAGPRRGRPGGRARPAR